MRKIIFFAFLIVSVANVLAQVEKSVFQYDAALDYYYCLPRNYNVENGSGQFPLVIYLHGGGGYGRINGLDYLGYSDTNASVDQVAEDFQTNYPSFVLVPQSKRGWDANKLITVVEKFKSIHPVDDKRIYLIGYSMGGSGSYIFLNGYYDYNHTLFAAVIRLAGQSQTTLRDSIALNSSIWLHIGLEDNPKRVDITREAYKFLKLKHPDAKELEEQISINEIRGTTLTLHGKDGIEVKKTEYDGVGHDIYRFPFNDKRLISWLFNQKIRKENYQ